MPKNLPTTCPACESPLQITGLECPQCQTRITGSFPLSTLLTLSRPSQEFLWAFLTARGNFKDLEARLGLSYPTLRNRLNALLNELGLIPAEIPEVPETEPTQSVLDRLQRGEISPTDAVELLKRR